MPKGKIRYYGMTVKVDTGTTYWQKGSYATVDELVDHVQRYARNTVHLVVYRTVDDGWLELVEHRDHPKVC